MVKLGYCFGLCVYDIYLRYWTDVVGTLAISPGPDAFKETLKNPASFILLFYCLAICIFVGILAVFHCRLVSCNTTTNEHVRIAAHLYFLIALATILTYPLVQIKGTFKVANPFNRGCLRNWVFMCCPPAYDDYTKVEAKLKRWQETGDIEAPLPRTLASPGSNGAPMGNHGIAGFNRWRSASTGSAASQRSTASTASKRTGAKTTAAKQPIRSVPAKAAGTATTAKKTARKKRNASSPDPASPRAKRASRKRTKKDEEDADDAHPMEPKSPKERKRKPKKPETPPEEESPLAASQSLSSSSSSTEETLAPTPKSKRGKPDSSEPSGAK